MLTKTLLARGATVFAVETDSRAYEILQTAFLDEINTGKLKLFLGDAREITPTSLGLKPYSYKVIANIPYYLSGFLLRLMLESANQPSCLVFLIQKELAHRITRDKKESLLALSVRAFGTPKYYKTIGRGHFRPQPKVDSAILQINNVHHNNFSQEGGRLFFELLHIGLGKKRKQLMTNLKEFYPKEQLEEAFLSIPLSLKIRGEDVPLATWLRLLYTLNPQTIPPQSIRELGLLL
jgi:16S rRNA (adenine1518-N6/adenine1519-N6)-dimethyltransferase